MRTKALARALSWWIVNLAYAVAIHYALVKQNEGIGNVVIFFTCLLILGSVGVASDKKSRLELREKGRPVPTAIALVYDFLVTSVFCYYAWWGMGIGYFIATVAQAFIYEGKESDLEDE